MRFSGHDLIFLQWLERIIRPTETREEDLFGKKIRLEPSDFSFHVHYTEDKLWESRRPPPESVRSAPFPKDGLSITIGGTETDKIHVEYRSLDNYIMQQKEVDQKAQQVYSSFFSVALEVCFLVLTRTRSRTVFTALCVSPQR